MVHLKLDARITKQNLSYVSLIPQSNIECHIYESKPAEYKTIHYEQYEKKIV
jgi:hypothetical protein